MAISKDWGWGSRQKKGAQPFQDKSKKHDPWQDHRNAQAARKHEESERKIAAWIHIVDRQTGKKTKQRVRGTRRDIESEVSNLRRSMGGAADVVIHTWLK